LGKTQNPNYLLTFLGYKEMNDNRIDRSDGKGIWEKGGKYNDKTMEE
jgi:hypothetical protein